jgi:hypothetical protein
MAGQGDIEEHVFFRPTGNTYGTAMRAFDPKTGEWAIWWVDSRYPHFPLDPPAKGRFESGVGTFYSDSQLGRWWQDMGHKLGHGIPACVLAAAVGGLAGYRVHCCPNRHSTETPYNVA